VQLIIFRVVAGGDAAHDFAAAAGEKKFRFAVFEKRVLFAIEKFLALDHQRRHPDKIVRIDFPRQLDEGVAVAARNDLLDFDLSHDSILA